MPASAVLLIAAGGLWGVLCSVVTIWAIDRRTARREPGYNFVLKRGG